MHGEQAKEWREDRRIEGRIMHRAGHAGEVGVHVAVSARERSGESGIESVVVEDADERLIEREKTDRQGGGGGDQTSLYFPGKRQVSRCAGTKRL